MAFQAKTWGWKGLAARLLLVPVIAGSAAGGAAAQSGPADKARALVAQANQALQSGDLTAAERYAKQAQMLKASLAADEPRPENVLAEVQKRKIGTAPAAAAAPAAVGDPKELVKLAKQALAAGKLDLAQDYATKANQAAVATNKRWGLLDDTPASVMKDVQDARGKSDKTRSEQLFKDAKAVYAKPAKSDTERMANLEQALTLAYQAKNLHGPYSMWDLGDKPDKLISEVESAKAQLRKKMPAASEAIARTPTPAAPKLPATPTAGVKAPVLPAAAAARPTEPGKLMPAVLNTTKPITTATAPPKPLPATALPAGPKAPDTLMVAAPKAPAVVPKAAAVPAVSPKVEVMRLVAEGRAALAQEKVIEARGKATEARRLAGDKGLPAAFGAGEDSPELLHQDCQAKGKQMIEALTKSATEMTAVKRYTEADAALDYARTLSEGLGLYTKPIDEQKAMVAKLSGKGSAAPVEVVAAPVAPPATFIVPVTPPAPAVAVVPTPVAPPVPMGVPAMPSPIAPAVAVVPPAPAPKVNLIDQAAAELKRNDLDMARKIALQAHTDPATKDQAQALLREIAAEELAVKQKTAKLAFDNGLKAYQENRYENALGVFRQIDPTHLAADQKAKYTAALADCAAKCAGEAVKLASGPGTASQPGVAKVGGDPAQPIGGGLAEQQKALAEVAYQKLREDGFAALNKANAAWGKGETDAALQALTDYATRVRASNQSPSRQAMLLRPVEERAERFRLLKHHTDFLVKEAKDKTDVRRDMLAANVAEGQKQEEIKRKVKQVNELTKAHKFKEAELAAAQAKQLDPDDPTLTYIVEQTKNRRRMEEAKQLRGEQEQLVLDGLNDAEKQGRAATLENPLIVNPERSRNAIDRGVDGAYMRARTQSEIIIDQRLSAPYSFSFKNASLRDVIDDVRKKSQLNIVTDDAAIDDEKVSLADVMVTEEVKDLSLRDGLTILLGKARLAFVVENNVIKVTSEKRSRGRMTTKVFHVMELVTPIPEYRPAPHHRLDTAIADARGTTLPGALAAAAGSGGITPRDPAGGLTNGEMVSNGQGAGGAAPFLRGAGSLENNLQSQPTAMTPQRERYAKQLKNLITGMVRPYAWQAMGGPGNIEYYDIGGAMVVNQTADVIREVADLLEALRRLQDLSVAVEIRVISLSEAFFERVGVDFALNVKTHNTTFERQLATSSFRPEPFLNDINNKGVVVGYNPAVGGFTPDLDFPIRSTSYGLSLPPFGGYQPSLGPTTNGGLALGLAFLNDIQVYMFLEAAQGNRRVNVMQAPKITLFNGQTATVFVGDVAYFTTGLQVFNVGGQFVYLPQNVAFPIGPGISPQTGNTGGVSVTVQAVISADRRFVRLNLSPTLTALASATVPLFPVSTFITPVFEGGSQGQPVPFTQFFQQPSFSEITAQTTVAVPDGGTVLLGGLKTLAQARNEFGPPVISQVPYLNRLFKNVGVGQETRHVMMMVTPRIIINSEEEARQVGEGGGLLPPQN